MREDRGKQGPEKTDTKSSKKPDLRIKIKKHVGLREKERTKNTLY